MIDTFGDYIKSSIQPNVYLAERTFLQSTGVAFGQTKVWLNGI